MFRADVHWMQQKKVNIFLTSELSEAGWFRYPDKKIVLSVFCFVVGRLVKTRLSGSTLHASLDTDSLSSARERTEIAEILLLLLDL